MLNATLTIAHLIGVALGIGAGTVKFILLVQARRDTTRISTYLAVAPAITKVILIGMGLLIISGLAWLVTGYPLSGWLIAKLVMVAAIIAMGATLDKVVEPKFRGLAPLAGVAATPAFARAHGRYLTIEFAATGLFYAITIYWLLLLSY